jgi:hypothetical protein
MLGSNRRVSNSNTGSLWGSNLFHTSTISDMTIQFVTFGMFIIDEFSFADEQGKLTGKTVAPQGS